MTRPALQGAFNRAIAILPGDGEITVLVEDDLHHMRVTLRHDGETVQHVDAEVIRAPWSTCPGAEVQLAATFHRIPLAEAAQVGAKKQNCTHLFDLAVLGAAHALDDAPLRYDLKVTDPVDGVREITIRRDGDPAMHWTERDRCFTEPSVIAGRNLLELGDWIASLPPADEEMARLLRGSAIISHGRQIPMEKQSDATKIPANCYTFQPETAAKSRRINGIHDFTEAMDGPLHGIPATSGVG